MKKIAKLSLVASLAVAGLTTTVSADSLAQAFADAKVKGEIKSLYFQKEKESGADAKSSIWSNGGNLSLTTGSYYGLKAGVTFQTAHVGNIDDEAGNYAKDMDVSGSVMSQAFLSYGIENTTVKVGRQYIKTRLVAGSGSRILKQSFEGIVLANTDLPQTTLVVAYVDKYQNRTDLNGNVPKFDQAGDGAYTIYAKNKSIDNLTLEAQYLQAKPENGSLDDDAKIFYAQAAYKLSPITLEVQTYQSDNGAAGNVETKNKEYGVKLSGKFGGFSAAAAYTTIDSGAEIESGIGSGADEIFTAAPISSGNYDAQTDAYKLDLGYKFGNGLGLSASYTDWETDGGDDSSETNITAKYKFNKNLSTKIMYSTFGGDYSYDYRSRVYLSYKF